MIQSAPIMNRFEKLDLDQALRLIVEGTATETGTRFYAALVQALAETLNTTGAWITEYMPESERLRALAFWLNGQWVSEYEYDLEGTPCQLVIKNAKPLHIPDNVAQLFPNDPDLAAFRAVSYLGVPLQNEDGSVLGHLAILDSQPLPSDPRLFSFFRIFAARAAAQHRRLRAEGEIREREEKLNRLISSALDSIVELDQDLKITVVNKAAIDLFNLTQAELLGQDFEDRLSSKGFRIFSDLLKQLNEPNSNQQQVWIPTGLELVGNNSQTFPVEATISRSTSQRRHFYTLILRNINQRQEAERQIRELTAQTEYLKEELKSLHNFDE